MKTLGQIVARTGLYHFRKDSFQMESVVLLFWFSLKYMNTLYQYDILCNASVCLSVSYSLYNNTSQKWEKNICEKN